MECSFCKTKCRPVSPVDFINRLPNAGAAWIKDYQCDYHGAVQVRFRVSSQDNLIMTILVFKIREEAYAAYFYHDQADTVKFSCFKMSKKKFEKSEEVFHLDFHPNITPENFEAKLSLYMVFS